MAIAVHQGYLLLLWQGGLKPRRDGEHRQRHGVGPGPCLAQPAIQLPLGVRLLAGERVEAGRAQINGMHGRECFDYREAAPATGWPIERFCGCAICDDLSIYALHDHYGCVADRGVVDKSVRSRRRRGCGLERSKDAVLANDVMSRIQSQALRRPSQHPLMAG
jgi:hypothetical protein